MMTVKRVVGGIIFATKNIVTMRNTINEIVPAMMPAGNRAESDDCMNMRRGGDGSLVAVGRPAVVAGGDYRPLCKWEKDGRQVVIAARGNYVYEIAPGGEPVQVAVAVSSPLGAVSVADGVLLLLDDSVCRLVWNAVSGQWSLSTAVDAPPVSLRVMSTARFSASSAPCTLAGGYTHWQGQLTARDQATVTVAVKGLYAEVCDKARQAGCYVQPVVARYLIYDAGNRVIAESAPVMLSPEGLQGVDPIEAQVGVTDSVYNALGALTLEVTGFTIGYETGGGWDALPEGCTVKIGVTPQLHPVDMDAGASVRLEGATALSGVLRVSLPGVADCHDRCARYVSLLMSHLDSVAATVHEMAAVQGGGVLPMAASGDIAAEMKVWKSLRPVDDDDGKLLLGELNRPHRFAASVGRVVGDIVVWGDVTAVRSDGYPVTMLAVTDDAAEGRWYACSQVTFATGGETVVWSGEGEGNAPLMLSPLLSYPHRQAVAMKVTVCYADGTVRSREVKLSPAAGRAVYVDPSFAPLPLDVTEEAYVIPRATGCRRRYEGVVAVARSVDALSPVVAGVVSTGRVVAVTQAVRSSSSWDFARSHLYAFTGEGICAVAINSQRTRLSSNVIDRRRVVRGDAVAVTPSRVYALASGSLVAVAGSRSETIAARGGYVSLGWNGVMGELWCARDDGSVEIRADGGVYRRDLTADALYEMSDGSLLVAADGCLLDAADEVAGDTAVAWSERLPAGRAPARLTAVAWRLYASQADVALSVKGDRGGNTPLTIVRFDVKGEINSQVGGRVYAPARRYITLSVSGRVSADARFESVMLKTEKL